VPLEPFANAPRRFNRLLLSRRGMLHAGPVPLLALRAPAGGRNSSHAAILPPEGADSSPLGLAIGADGKTAYAAFSSADVILVVDLRQGVVRSAIDLSPAGVIVRSRQAVLSADGKLLFVATLGTGNVTVIDTAQERVKQVLPLNATSGDCFKATAQGKVHIALGSQLAIVDCNDLSYRIVRVSGVVFNSIALSPSRANLLYCVGSSTLQGVLRAVNLDTGAVEREAALPKEATDRNGNVARFDVDRSGNVAYFGFNWPINSAGSGNFTAFDLSTFRVIATTPIEDGVSDFAVHPETGKVYAVGSYEGALDGRVDRQLHIVEWDPAARAVSRRLPLSPSSVLASIRLDPANPRFAYTTETFLNFIRKVDLATGAEVMRVRFFTGDRRPNAVTTDGTLAYVACLKSPSIHRLDLDSGKLLAPLPMLGRLGAGGCEYYQGKLYLTGGRTIGVVNPADGSTVLSRTLPDNLSLSPKVTFFRDRLAGAAYLPGRSPDRILILDARTLDAVDSFPLEMPLIGRIGGATASPDGSKLYVLQGFQYVRTILQVLDSSSLRVLARIELPTATFQGGDGDFGAFDEQNRIAYLGGFCSVYKVHLDTNEYLGMLNIYDVYTEMGRPQRGWATSALRGIHLTPPRDRLLVTSWDGHSVFMYDLRNQKWIPRVTRVGVNPAGSVLSPDGRSLYTANALSDTISRVDTASGELIEVTPLGGPASVLGTSNLRHGASFQILPVVPGAVVAIVEGATPGEIGPPFLTSLRLDETGRVATELAGTKVLFDGVPAPILYAYASQVGVVVPYSVAGKQKVTVQLIYKGLETYPFEQNVSQAYPGIFTMDSSGGGQAAALNQDGTLNAPDNPAARGSVVVFYATGAGQTDPAGVDGLIAADVLARPRLPVTVWMAGQEAEVLYAGAAPGIVSGVMQVNVKVPMNVPSDNQVAIAMRVGNSPTSQDGVTVAVR
jgi:uncharacterized protein (TIGR03437 family)